MPEKKRAALDFDDADTLDITELAGKSLRKPPVDIEQVHQVAAATGFPSRDVKHSASPPVRRRRRRSPYTDQLGVKVRPEMKALFQSLGDHLEVYDHTVFEQAILALIEKSGTDEHKQQFKDMLT